MALEQPQVILDQKLRELRKRMRLLAALKWASILALYASAIALVLTVASKFHWLEVYPEAVAAALVLAAGIGAAIGYFRRISPMETARRTESRLDLKERLSSALEFLGEQRQDPLVALQIEDAAAHSARIDPRLAYPAQVPREARFFAIALAALVLLTVLPELPMFQSPKERMERAQIKKQGEEIVRVAKEMQKAATANKLDLAKRISRNMELLGKDMMRNRLTKKQALMQMHKLDKQMAAAMKKLQTPEARKLSADALKDMKKAADSMPDDLKKTELGKMMQQMAEAAARKDFRKANELARKMMEMAQSGKISKQDMQKAAAQLAKMAQGLKGSQLGDMASKMQKAAEAASSGDMKKAAEQMAKAMESAQQADQKMAESQQLQKMAEAMQASQQEMQEGERMARQPGAT